MRHPKPHRSVGSPQTLRALVAALVLLIALPLAADELPWRQAGLTERQAAAHLLDRLTFGPRPGDVDAVVEMGLEQWVERQLDSSLGEGELDRRLAPLETIGLPAEEAAERFPNPGILLRQLMRQGLIDETAIRAVESGDRGGPDEEMRQMMLSYATEKGYGSQRQLIGEAMVNKLFRAIYAENQLQEVLTDFWFNHFNVSITDNQSRNYVPSYEHDAIRPYVLADFRDMLGATARHPAMLLYLDNARSTAEEGAPTTMSRQLGQRYGEGARRRGMERYRKDRNRRPDRSTGLNENYARELLELHTLGVDGGYTQEDVIEVARAFTGWSVVPPRMLREMEDIRLERALSLGVGFEKQGSFLFRADAHDEGEKRILGTTFMAGQGIEEGEKVLDLVASHPSTAHHLSRKLAVRFVSDEPPEVLVDRLAATFERSDGDLEKMIETLVYSAEFWAPEARRQKIKSPFELAVSSLRILDAEITNPRATVEWITQMGQPLYAYQAPTGYPDRGDFWVNTGSLLNRMNFALELATGRIRGVRVDLEALNAGREPESLVGALDTYAALLLPERDLAETLARLEPMIADPEVTARLAEAAPEPVPGPASGSTMAEPFWARRVEIDRSRNLPQPTPLAQVVGVILGSPEFQRR